MKTIATILAVLTLAACAPHAQHQHWNHTGTGHDVYYYESK